MGKPKKILILMMMCVLLMQAFALKMSVFAYSNGNVVINEIAWAGTADGSNDEWIELYNNTSAAIDLAGWKIEDDVTTSYTIASGSIAPHGYFLIEDSEDTVKGISADSIIGLSLANAGDSLVLKDNAANVIDTVNGSGGVWYAGDATTKATMERIDPSASGDSASNWGNCTAGNGAVGRTDIAILGTPKGANSNYGGGGMAVTLNIAEDNSNVGDNINAVVSVDSALDMYAYGFEINYNPDVLNFVSATEGAFLKSGGVSTSFNAAKQDGVEGVLIVGNARMQNPPTGVDGAGSLFTIVFEVVGTSENPTGVTFGPQSFVSDTLGNAASALNGDSISFGATVDSFVGNLNSVLGTNGYSFNFTWTAPASGADKYIIKKKMPDGNFYTVAESTTLSYLDANADIINNVLYNYQIIASKGGVLSAPVAVTIKETRGLSGDNNKSGRVDGKDLEALARAYGSGYGDEEYNLKADSNFDGIIDGSDLIDLGINFGMKL
ncbi:MAG: lamin tail domain-containing protein [Candidatus Gracilibacteria bacterium]